MMPGFCVCEHRPTASYSEIASVESTNPFEEHMMASGTAVGDDISNH